MTIDRHTMRMIRRVYGLTQQEMGAALYVSDTHICNVESGVRAVSRRLAARLIFTFGLTEAKLARMRDVEAEFNGREVGADDTI
ncbi:helix-turn-helix transcriptional regulator [Alkalicoccus chagannorensis]|uniref:helix-turn-helix transcriptional regulator n=1 Tax=Alkalicoccus chagannorensis TaxID=427072 RepID=UPI000423E033|nr:helix-turn-helix transcriptional regulator [Alkalicoccus chagannorensis]